MRRHPHHALPGQSLVTLAVFAVLLFITMGLAIDGGMIYAQRRLMQNTADAACLAAANKVALNDTKSDAILAATTVIQDNLGATPGANLNAPGTLAYTDYTQVYGNVTDSNLGVNLVKGIEVSAPDVRVALQSPATTYFMRVIGVASYTVAARAHCNSAAGGGGTPFAVARWRGYDGSNDLVDSFATDYPLPQYYRHGKKTDKVKVRDILQGAGTANGECCSMSTLWPWQPSGPYPGNPTTPRTGIYTQASPQASSDDPGYPTIIVGKGAQPNKGDPTFNGPIVLDFRNITTGVTYYPPLDPATSLQNTKKLLSQYILNGYGGPLVDPGTQVGYYSGISAGQVEKIFEQRFKKDDIITLLVYNGTTYENQAFKLSFANSGDETESRPKSLISAPLCDIDLTGYIRDTNVADYPLVVAPGDPNTTLSTSYNMRAFLSTDGSSYASAQGQWFKGSSTALTSWGGFNSNGFGPEVSSATTGTNFTFKLQQSASTTCGLTAISVPDRQDGAQAIYLEMQDASNDTRRARYAFINMEDVNSKDFYAYIPGEIVYEPFEPGQSGSVQFNIDQLNSAGTSLTVDKTSDVSFSWFDATSHGLLSSSTTGGGSSYKSTYNGVTVELAKQGNGNNLNIDLDKDETIATPGQYYVRIAVTYQNRTHWAWYYIRVNPPLSNASSINKYVYILGYANFKITEVKASNYVKAQAVSGLLGPNEISVGMQARLLPW
jgi:Flp pilus assembly protein TadG